MVGQIGLPPICGAAKWSWSCGGALYLKLGVAGENVICAAVTITGAGLSRNRAVQYTKCMLIAVLARYVLM